MSSVVRFLFRRRPRTFSCGVCHALVDEADLTDHHEWHDRMHHHKPDVFGQHKTPRCGITRLSFIPNVRDMERRRG